ncbi:MAG: Hpt domain-containing protein [Clostridia bacterium]|nr:Hpt domain-containing protein [Clostridia bacterium]
MNSELLRRLSLCETDIDGAIRRFSGNEALYISCLNAFLLDPTVQELNEAILAQDWDGAFTAAHALKGLAGNMGFIPLFHATGELVVLIRSGRLMEINESNEQLRNVYNELVTAIRLGSQEN